MASADGLISDNEVPLENAGSNVHFQCCAVEGGLEDCQQACSPLNGSAGGRSWCLLRNFIVSRVYSRLLRDNRGTLEGIFGIHGRTWSRAHAEACSIDLSNLLDDQI